MQVHTSGIRLRRNFGRLAVRLNLKPPTTSSRQRLGSKKSRRTKDQKGTLLHCGMYPYAIFEPFLPFRSTGPQPDCGTAIYRRSVDS
jgi:hypothetical protein